MSQPFSSAQRFDPSVLPAPSYEWVPPGKSLTVRLPFDLIDRLEHLVVDNFRSIDARGSEIGGLLFGGADPAAPSTVSIEDFEPIPCDYSRGPLYRLSEADLARFDDAIERRAGAAQTVAGFFRSHSRKGLALDAEDMAVIEARFRDPSQVVLLVRPFATKVSAAGVFMWEDGRMRGEASYLEFPFRSSELPAAASRGDLGTLAAGTAGAPPPGPRPVMRAPVVPMPPRLKIARPSAPATTVSGMVEPAAGVSGFVAPPIPPSPPPSPATDAQSAPPAAKPEEPASALVSRPAVRVDTPKPAEPAAKPEEPASVLVSRPPRLDSPKLAEPAFEPKPAEPAPDPYAMETEAPAAPVRALRGKLRWLAVAAALAACSGALILFPGLTRHAATRPPAALTLRVEHTATDLLLTWNQDSDAVRNAKKAILSISDGERQENLDLNLSDLRNGSIVYSPLSADVSFRMEIVGPDQSKTASESVRVLRTKPSPMPPADAPAAPAAARTQPNGAPQGPSAPPPAAAAEQPAGADASGQPPAAKPAPIRTFSAVNVATLADRLRPATPADLPDAPVLGATPGAAGSVNFGVLTPAQISMPLAPSAPSDAKSAAAAPPEIRQPQLTSIVKPEYPDIARRQGISGVVSLSVTIGANGRIKTVKALSGPELLRRPAMDAVKQWVYSPATVNGRPVDSEKQLDVTFTLPR
jgi:protein TonB